jgi:hypothetical protein
VAHLSALKAEVFGMRFEESVAIVVVSKPIKCFSFEFKEAEISRGI